jgi:hypothetical protein
MGLRFFDGGQQVEQTPTGKRCERTLALLQMRDNPSFMIIYEGCAWDGDMSGNEYLYEHTCPTNLMRCVEIIADGRADPHGVFEIVEEHLITGPSARPREKVIEELTALAVEKTRMAKLPSRQKANQMVWDAIGSDYGFCNPMKCRITDEDEYD